MSGAGYNPLEMAHFFEKLAGEGGPGVPQFLSDHPSPGNRVKAVEAEIRTFPRRQYANNSSEFSRMKTLAQKLPPPPPQKRPQSADGAAQR